MNKKYIYDINLNFHILHVIVLVCGVSWFHEISRMFDVHFIEENKNCTTIY